MILSTSSFTGFRGRKEIRVSPEPGLIRPSSLKSFSAMPGKASARKRNTSRKTGRKTLILMRSLLHTKYLRRHQLEMLKPPSIITGPGNTKGNYKLKSFALNRLPKASTSEVNGLETSQIRCSENSSSLKKKATGPNECFTSIMFYVEQKGGSVAGRILQIFSS